MALLTQPAADTHPASGAGLWRSPQVLAVFLPGFAAAMLCGWALAGRLKSGEAGMELKTALGGGGLLLLHAQEETVRAREKQAAAQNQDFTRLNGVVTELKVRLAGVESQIQESEKKLVELEATAGSAATRKNAFLAEKERLEQVLAAFAKAEAERAKAEQAMKAAAMPADGGDVTAKDLAGWSTEWQAMTSDAAAKIKTARTAVLELQQLKTAWEAGQESFSAAEKTEMQGKLTSQQSTTENSLKAARAAVAAAEKPLLDKIKAEGEQLAQVIKNTAP